MSEFLTLDVSEVGRLGSVEQLTDNKRTPTYKWFSLGQNGLDGTFTVVPDTPGPELERGWWSAQSTDYQGRFAQPPTITGTYTPQPMFAVTLIGDELTNNYPTELNITYYDSMGQVARIDYVRNDLVTLVHPVNLPDVGKINIEILATNIPNSELRLLEVQILLEDTYITELMDNPNRQIACRVTIKYLNPFKTYTITPHSDDTAPYTFIKQTTDGIKEATYKWFSLTNNMLDGSYHPLPAKPDPAYQLGWWSAYAADENGVFAQPPKITIDITPQPVLGLTLIGDIQTDNYPVDFDVQLYRGETLIFQDELRDNTKAQFTKRYVYDDISKYILVFHKVSRPLDQLRILEIGTSFEEIYEKDKLFGVNVLEELNYAESLLPVGFVSANEIDVEISDEEHEFDITRPDSPYKGILLKNREIKVEMGTELYPGYIKWYPFGTFYSTRWNVKPGELSTTVTGLDVLELLRQETFLFSEVKKNISLYDAFKYVLDSYRLLQLKYKIDESLKDIVIPYLWFGRIKFRDALLELSRITTAVIYVDRHNVIQIRKLQIPDKSRYVFRNSFAIFDRNYPTAWLDNTNYVIIEGQTYIEKNTDSVFGVKEDVVIEANTRKAVYLEAAQAPLISVDISKLIIPSSLTVRQKAITGWGIYLDIENTTGNAISFPVQQIPGVHGQLEHNFTSEAQDREAQELNGTIEFKTHSPLMQDVNYAQQLANELLEIAKHSELDIELDSRGHISLLLEDRIGVEDITGQSVQDYIVTRQDTFWDGGYSCKVKGKMIPEGVR